MRETCSFHPVITSCLTSAVVPSYGQQIHTNHEYQTHKYQSLSVDSPMNGLRKKQMKNTFPRFRTEILDSRPLEPVLWRKFHVVSKFEVKNFQFRRPEAKH